MNSGKGKCADLFKDFGNVHTATFKEWWSQGSRAVDLFAEPLPPALRVIDPSKQSVATGGSSVLIEVPLALPITFLTRQFKKVIGNRQKRAQGRRAKIESKARYRVSGKVDLNFLSNALAVWDMRREIPELPLWRIVQDLKLMEAKHWVRDGDSRAVSTDKRNLLAATGSRLLRKANAMIANVAKGRFPDSVSQRSRKKA